MPRKSWMMTPEEVEASEERRKRDRIEADARLLAGIDALERGEDIDTAMHAATGEVTEPPRVPSPDVDPEAMPRLCCDGWTPAKQRGFLVRLAQTGCVSQACETVGLSRQSAYALRRRAPNSVFAIGWDVAILLARQVLLDEATERAFQGREVPVWYHGEQVGTRIVHNDRLLMFLLGQRREPIHPRLDARELTQLFPAMLRMVDTVLPPAFSAERIRELVGGAAGGGDA